MKITFVAICLISTLGVAALSYVDAVAKETSLKTVRFNSSGTYKPSPKAMIIYVYLKAGDGGQGLAPGGEGGAMSISFKPSQLGEAVTVEIGSGGNSGQPGGDSRFGSLLTVYGGRTALQDPRVNDPGKSGYAIVVEKID